MCRKTISGRSRIPKLSTKTLMPKVTNLLCTIDFRQRGNNYLSKSLLTTDAPPNAVNDDAKAALGVIQDWLLNVAG